MKFHLSEEQLAMTDSVRRTLRDRFTREDLLSFVDGDSDHVPSLWTALMALGLGSLAIPERDGGAGLGLLDLALLVEAVGESATPGALIQHLIVALAIASSDDQHIKTRFLAGLMEGSAVATLALAADPLVERKLPVFDGHYLFGDVAAVPGAMSASLLLIATAEGDLVLLADEGGVTKQVVAATDRTRPMAHVHFDRAPALLLFRHGDPRVDRIIDAALILIAADALGGAQHCLDLSTAYAKEREQFGQPIGRFQALKHQLAAMAMEVEPARALLWYAAHAWDAALPDARHAAAQAKAHITDRFVSVSRAAVEAHGAIGYTWEYGLHLWVKRALFDQAYLGSSSYHRARAAEIGSMVDGGDHP